MGSPNILPAAADHDFCALGDESFRGAHPPIPRVALQLDLGFDPPDHSLLRGSADFESLDVNRTKLWLGDGLLTLALYETGASATAAWAIRRTAPASSSSID